MASNEFKAFATGGTANALTPAAYAALATLISDGFQAGIAESEQFNTVMRQATFPGAVLGKLIYDNGGDALDNGVVATFQTALVAALQTLVVVPMFTGSNRFIGANGYQKLPGGLIKQWGVVTIAQNASGTLTFPLAFPSAVYGLNLTDFSISGNIALWRYDTPTLANAPVRNVSIEGEAVNRSAYWEAIGA